MIIRTPDYHLRVFVSSTLKELAEERKAVRQAILNLRLSPVMFESGARPHPPQELYKSYISQSQIFIGIYWQSYGWVAPEARISGLEDEYNLSVKKPRLIYIKNPAPEREPALVSLLGRIRNDNSSCYTSFSTSAELEELVQNDLALLLTEQFESITPNEQPNPEERHRPLTNVPIPRNQLIDRGREIADISSLLQQDEIALITLTGTGGTGKSRLAIQIGLESINRFKDGVYLVVLEPINDPNLVIPTIAETLGLHESPGSLPIAEMLKEFLRDKQMLLILDNFEQVVEAAPRVSELLEACPRLKCIVTSRTSLHLRAENEYPVPPLLVPSLQQFANLGSLSQYAAVELFIQRAQAVKSDFTVTNANAPAVAEVCYRLDGLPLAIELAAARIKLLTPNGLLARMEHRFDLLKGGTRDLPERQRTLRGAIDWSYDLLTETEKKLFTRLSVFIGGWTLEAAETVCDIGGDLAQSLDDALASLIDSNLVIQLPQAEDEPRFGMLSTIHEYAFERLVESEENETIHQQHAQYFLNFVTYAEPRVRSAQRTHWRQIMLQEFGNIRGVLAWTYTTKKCIEIGQQIVANVGLFWQFGGYIVEGRQWCARMLCLCDESTPVSTRVGLLCYSGELAWTQGDFSLAVENLDESLGLCETSVDKHLLAIVMVIRGMVASTIRDLSTATAMLQDGIELLQTIDDDWYKAFALAISGEIALYQNDLARATLLLDQSILLARQQGDPWIMMPSLMGTGQMAVLQGDCIKARLNFTEAVDLLRHTGDNVSLSWALIALGSVLLMQGELAQAGIYILESLKIANEIGVHGVIVISLTGTAAMIATRSKVPPDKQEQNTAELALAAHLCGATVPIIATPGIFVWADSKKLYDTAINHVQCMMSAELWKQAYNEGQNMPIDQAIALAIQALNSLEPTIN